jgi:pilin isopeptide linkage protein/LPXTG-motif cell wall-anchored protein
MKNLLKRCVTMLLSLAMVLTYMPMSMITAYAAVGDTPAHTKKITDNGDGTYTISLDVVGDAVKKPNNVNVIVIVDTSGSMTQQRMTAAKKAVNSLADSLYAYNTTSAPDTVEMALVRFATSSNVAQRPTNSSATFKSAVSNLGNSGNGGTNWESALQTANDVNFDDNDQTFAVFVSDGNPTFRTTQNGWNDWSYQYQQYGTGQETDTNVQRCYTTAVDDAEALAKKVGVKNFFTIGAFGNVDRMEQLTVDAGSDSSTNYYSASDTAALNKAIADILAKIEMSGIANTEIDDGTTNQVTTSSGEVAELLEVDTSSFKYYRSGGSYGNMQAWADAPEAEFTDGTVEWDLASQGVLENGVKYTVTFDCYPSQETYDTIAKLKNGDLKYADLDSEIKKYIVDNGDGSYSLRTNTNATLSYDDTRDDAGQQTAGYKNPDPVATDAETLAATKEWEGGSADTKSLDMTVLMDDKEFHTTEMTEADGWSTSSFISIGIIKNGKVLPGAEGHDFKFAELDDTQYHWELETPTVHPMLIDGTKTMLIKVDEDHQAPSGADTYTINGATYYVDKEAAGLKATNHRRSNLNLTKVVTGEDAPADAKFPFELTVNNSKAPATAPSQTEDPGHDSDYWIWLSVRDENGQGVTGLDLGSEVVEDSGGYYYAPNGTTFNIEIGAGWGLRFLNLPTGTTYTFTEGTLPTGFAFNKSELTQGTDTTFSGDQTTTGTIQNTKTSYSVKYTNDYQLTDLEITKTWVDANNQDGKRLTAAQLKEKLTLSPAVQGKEATVTDNGDNTYTIKYTGLPRFNNGEEVEYTVAEASLEDIGYSTTGSPAKDHETITNTHTPETTEVKVVKVWDDSNNIGGIRPASINAQLNADGEASGDPVALNADNKWTYTWENLPKYKNGTLIEYTADETAVPAGYDKKVEKTTAQDGTVTFTVTNTYNPTPVSVDPPVQKVITGNDALYNKGDFTFTIAATSPADAPMPSKKSITNVAANEVKGKTGYYEFGEITFTKPGTYTYKVTESGKVDGVTNDSAASTGKTLTFTVSDDGTGKLVVDPTTDQVQLGFTNVYNAEGEASIVVSKEVTGAAWPKGKSLTLTIAGANGAPMPEAKTVTLDAAGSATFGPIAYKLSDAGKSYEYTITESSFGAGWSGSPESIKATVKVTDDGKGNLNTEVTYSPKEAKFTNKYQATGTATLEVTKALAGAAWPAGKKLTMTLAGTENAPMPAKGGETATLEKAGKATFGAITYTEADAGKTYTYTISENGFGDGWTGSGAVTATVKVTDNGDGTLGTEVTYTPGSDTITNTYAASGNATLKVTKAISGAAWPAGKSLTLTLAGEEGAPMPTATTTTLSAAGEATFGAIAYTAADAGKTYKYTITEGSFGAGWTGSPEKVTATVAVTDNGDGTLSTKVSYDPANATFTNTYKASGTATIEATKAIAGAAWPAGKKITLTLAGRGNAPMPAEGKETATLTAAGKAAFGEIKYDESDVGKTYEYTITEDGFGTGWTGSPASIKATVAVTDNGDGTLKTEVTYDPANATFTNTYKAAGQVKLHATKAIGSAEWPKGKTLTFTLAGEGGTLPEKKTVTLQSAGVAEFDAITYDESDIGKTYTYTISEDGFGTGWTGSGDVTATVVVSDNGNGTLKTDVTYSPENAVITNTYAAEGEVVLEASKNLTGRDWKEGEEFTFALIDSNGKTLEEKAVTSNDKVTFKALTYSLADMKDAEGKYASKVTKEYTISETSELPAGVAKSADVKAVVTLTDLGSGKIGTEVKYTPENATIVNTYTAKPTKAQIKVDKKITGYKPTADEVNGEFKMILTPVDNAPMPEGKDTLETTVTTKNGEGTGLFDEIEYTKAGTYKYEVTEEAGTKAGMTYDSNKYTVTVKVEDDLNGKLVATVKYAEESADSGEDTKTSVEVTNDFQIKPTEVTLNVTKKIKDESDSAEDATFTFVLKDSDKKVIDEKSVTTKDFTGSVDFDALKFEKDGTYTYYIQESIKEEDKKDGWTYDEEEYPVVIKISDDLKKAELVKDSVAYDGDETATTLEITNVYKAEPTTVSDITVNKTINDTSGSAYDTTFTFTLTGKDGAPMPENNKASVTGEGSVKFAEIKYEKAGTFKYTVKEEAADAKGYIYDTTEYNVTVTVTDKDGHLEAKVKYGEGESTDESTAIDIVNTYDPEDAKVKLRATKIVTDKTGSAPDETFTFELVNSDGDVVETVSRKMGGPVEFSEMTFSKVGTCTFKIREAAGSTPGYTYDSAEYTVTIKITDPDKDGVLKASVEGNNPEIENPYDVPPGKKSVTDQIPVTKELTGRDLEENEFEFYLIDSDGNVVGKARNDASGKVVFPPCTFDKVGEYTFTVVEVEGDLEDVTYDTTVYTVVATVTDPHTGNALEVNWTSPNGKKIVFQNDYEPPEEPEEPDKPDKPDTGDNNNVLGWLGLMALAAAGGTGLYIKRRREDEE